MSYNKLGFTKGQTLKAEHLNHMEEGIANAGGVSSWNDLTDKPIVMLTCEDFDNAKWSCNVKDFDTLVAMIRSFPLAFARMGEDDGFSVFSGVNFFKDENGEPYAIEFVLSDGTPLVEVEADGTIRQVSGV